MRSCVVKVYDILSKIHVTIKSSKKSARGVFITKCASTLPNPIVKKFKKNYLKIQNKQTPRRHRVHGMSCGCETCQFY